MNLIAVLLTWQFALMSLGVVVLTTIVRTIVEYARPQWRAVRLYQDLALPLLPLVTGAALALCLATFPYPAGLTSWADRMLFGAVAGLCSGFAYRCLKASVLNDGSKDAG